MHKIAILVIAMGGLSPALAQDIYLYPNKKLADEGQLEYRRYTLNEYAILHN